MQALNWDIAGTSQGLNSAGLRAKAPEGTIINGISESQWRFYGEKQGVVVESVRGQ